MKNSEQKSPQPKLLYDFCRYFVAFLIITYGWAKLMGSQFTVLDSELDKPMKMVSGFWLTWYYFGYSFFYGNLLGILQIVCGFLLLYRKTVLLATCVLFGILGKIILIDIFYGVDLGALLTAFFIELGVIVILSFHRKELLDLFWTSQNSVFKAAKNSNKVRLIKIALVAAFVILPPTALTILPIIIIGFRQKLTELGKSSVPQFQSPATDKPLTKIYFEHNRAFMTVFKFGDDKWKTHNFEIKPETKEINIWEKWLNKDKEIFVGKYQLTNEKLILDGTLKDSNQSVKIRT